MDRRYPSIRRRVKRARLQQRVAAGFMLGIALCALGFALTGEPDPVAAHAPARPGLLALAPTSSDAARPAPRRVYPYSIVPGGAATQTELARVIRTDKVVAAHYASFDVDKARTVTVVTPRAVHVSYRKGDKVYWTAKKVMLAEGETLLSDGSNEMRTRCANRISDVARFPVEAQEPSAEVLDSMVEEDGDGPARRAGDTLLAQDDGAGLLRATNRAVIAPGNGNGGARAATENAGGLPSSGASLDGMNSMTLAQFGSSASLDALLRSGAARPAAAGSAPPTLEVSVQLPGADVPEASASLPQAQTALPVVPDPAPVTTGGGTGSTGGTGGTATPQPQPGIPPVPGVRPPATGGKDARPPGGDLPGGSAGGGSGIANPGPVLPVPDGAGTKPDPFIPEPSLAPAAPAAGMDEEKPVEGDVPEPPTIWLLAAALAGMTLLRRGSRRAPASQAGIVSPAATAGRWRKASTAACTRGKCCMPARSPAS